MTTQAQKLRIIAAACPIFRNFCGQVPLSISAKGEYQAQWLRFTNNLSRIYSGQWRYFAPVRIHPDRVMQSSGHG